MSNEESTQIERISTEDGETLVDSSGRQLREEDVRSIMQQTRHLKRTLKQLGKNQLITLLLQQVNIAIEQQQINKVLLARLNEKEIKNG